MRVMPVDKDYQRHVTLDTNDEHTDEEFCPQD